MTQAIKATDVLHPADPMLALLDLCDEARALLDGVETLVVLTHQASTADDRYRAASQLSAHMRAIQSKTKVAWDKAGKVQNLALLACKKEMAVATGSAAGSYRQAGAAND